MTTDGLTTARLDVPTADVTAQTPTGVLLAAMAVTHSPSDGLAWALDVSLLAHPERLSTEATYPNWQPSMGCCPAHAAVTR